MKISDEMIYAFAGKPEITATDAHYIRTGLTAVLAIVEREHPADQTIREVQAAAWKNKVAKGFNTTDVPLEFCFMQAEVGEAFDAWRKGLPDLDEELADVALFLVSLAEMNGIDLQAAVEAKLVKNAGRIYIAGPNGYKVRTDQFATDNEAKPSAGGEL